jgi:alanine dehydrogenase
MVIGVPRETHRHEHRVGLTPFAVKRLTQQGHSVLVEKNAGLAARFTDLDYERAGARIVYEAEEVYLRADTVCRVGLLGSDEIGLLRPGAVVCAFHHLAVASRQDIERMAEIKATLIGYEIIRDAEGEAPVLHPFSEMAGQMAVHVGAHYLQNESGGRGILLGNVPGVPPPTVLILGAGRVGRAATRQALVSGAHVILLDADLSKLRSFHHEFGGQIVTVIAGLERLERYTAFADVVIGSVLIPGSRAPFVITEAMVKTMKPGSVILDVSIDQGGCVETSRPTTIDNPTFIEHDVLHYCVPNMTANVARTASRALASAALQYVERIAGAGVDAAIQQDPMLAAGVYLYRGNVVHEGVASALGMTSTPLHELL